MSPTRRQRSDEPVPAEQPALGTDGDVPPQPLDVLVPRDTEDLPEPDGPPRDRLDAHGHEIHARLTGTTEGHVPHHDPAAGTDAAAAPANAHAAGAAPDADRPKTTALATLIRTLKRFNAAGATDWAAALTYYGLQALFPGIIALVSVLGLFGSEQTTQTLVDIVKDLSPSTATDSIVGPLESITQKSGTAGVLFVVGLALSLWSASGYVGAFMRATNAIYGVEEGRPIWKLRPLQLLVTVITVVLLAAVLGALVLTGPVIDAVAGPLGIGDQAVSVWNYAKWPVMVLAVVVVLWVLYYSSPNVRLPSAKLIAPGALLALFVWVAASAAFAVYVANFSSYDKTYGTLGGVISLLIWIWISNCALLLGATLNVEMERTRELRHGDLEAVDHLLLEPRQAPKGDAAEEKSVGSDDPAGDEPGGEPIRL